MVGERGFEPPTPWSRTRCSTRLSHSPTYCLIYGFSILQGSSGWRKRTWAETISAPRYSVRVQRPQCCRAPKSSGCTSNCAFLMSHPLEDISGQIMVLHDGRDHLLNVCVVDEKNLFG